MRKRRMLLCAVDGDAAVSRHLLGTKMLLKLLLGFDEKRSYTIASRMGERDGCNTPTTMPKLSEWLTVAITRRRLLAILGHRPDFRIAKMGLSPSTVYVGMLVDQHKWGLSATAISQGPPLSTMAADGNDLTLTIMCTTLPGRKW